MKKSPLLVFVLAWFALGSLRAQAPGGNDTLTSSRMFIDMSSDSAGGITDGIKVDTKGNIYESGPRGIWILSREGKHLGTILTPEFVANVCFGDHDNKTLYVAARTGVYKIRVNIPGLR